jgi:hypothetical protein
VNVDGLFDHVPSDAVSVDPSFDVPLIVGGAVFCGVAAEAAAARTPTTASANITARVSFGLILMVSTPFRVRSSSYNSDALDGGSDPL